MGKVTKKILGATRGKVGDVVFRKFRTANVDSAYQPNPHNPKTEAQMLQRGLFSTMSGLAQAMAPAINKGMAFATKGTMLSPRNLFIRKNKSNFTSTVPGSVSISYPSIELAVGNPGHCDFSSPSFDDPLTIEAAWTPEGSAADANGKVVLAVYSPESNETLLSAEATVQTGRISMTVPSHWNGLKVHVWAMEFAAADDPENYIVKGQPFASVYVGTGNIG